MGYLNGVHYPGIMSLRTLFTKVIGVTLAVLSKLSVGKEGPLCHIGAICGNFVPHLPFIDLKFAQNDFQKRQFIAAGIASGVSVAFGSPIGGALFAYEVGVDTTFFDFALLWKTFFSAGIATFTLATLRASFNGIIKLDLADGFSEFQSSTLKFGNRKAMVAAEAHSNFSTDFVLFPLAIIIGIFGGIFGALFIKVSTVVNSKIRKRLLTTDLRKAIEPAFISVLSVTLFYWTPVLHQGCVKDEHHHLSKA